MNRYRKQRNYGCRIHDAVTYQGMRTIVMENELVRVSILADKGTDIFEFLYKPLDLDYMWLSEQGVHNPNAYLPTSPDAVSTFIDYYEGGWQEVFPNGGPPSGNAGAAFGQHGEVAQMPWDVDIIEDVPERITVRFSVRTKKLPCRLVKTLTLESGSAALTIHEQLDNESDVALRYMWGQHIALGQPFLSPGCVIELPQGVRIQTETPESEMSAPGRIRRGDSPLWPIASDHQGNELDLSILPERETASDIVYLYGFESEAWYTVRNPSIQAGLKVEWDGAVLPYLWYWQEFGASKGYPWYGRHYNIGLEPFAGYPTWGLEEAIHNGSAGTIGPRGRNQFTMRVTPFQL
ncbi:hypothetical protein A8709_15155 [Paenibacillus pectinilyticus]|uniref:DUF4432 domain-containing protein n=1 Tax=Paenibacillus pectinilyticus TaxID=512399 RepID=A0A1C1A4F6_9BACL|nr:DUF4432 family protein [Paenibacillus pectinilyticus]OCT15416.1 hypothetical protein A8709_15155 [Paenibacillus pectinilyticus]